MTETAFLIASLKMIIFKVNHYIQESESLIGELTRLIGEYKNEEHILNGGSITEEELRNIENNLYHEYFHVNLVNIIRI